MTGTKEDQAIFWDKQAGPKWVRQGEGMDALLNPVQQALLDRAAPLQGESVLDVGCGGGSSTIAAGGRVGPRGTVLGADVSATLLDLARRRVAAAGTDQVRFDHCDAETHPFEARSFDLMISRFGVMFFENSAAAFANMARALKSGGRMAFAAWGDIPANPYFTLPAAVSRQVFGGSPPKSDPDGPGPFAFRDPARILDILDRAGLQEGHVQVAEIELTAPGGAEAAADLMLEIGPAEAAINHFEADAEARAAVREGIVAALRPYERDGTVFIPAQINIATAVVGQRGGWSG
ncbi:MAG: methyltransferase domain-containing protein [Sulfitobacter sp.]|nr:methyltransferase domain-containing protein [Sulfitobacter sp.]